MKTKEPLKLKPVTRGRLRRIFCSLFLLAAVVAAVGAVASPRANRVSPGNVITVTNTNDSGPGSLRDALATATDGNTIDATGVTGTILLTSAELQVTHNVAISGPGTGSLAVNGNHTFRVFENFASGVTISTLTITNGFAADNNGGGGVLNHGGLTLGDSIVSNCATPRGNNQEGGGIFNDAGATLTLTGSTVTGNGAGCAGGGIYSTNAQLTVTNSTISSNSACGCGFGLHCGGSGGGISSHDGTLEVTNSMISGNHADGGGGISSDSVMVTVSNSTISGNIGGCSGGGISIGNGQLTVINSSTISGNLTWGDPCEHGIGGGIYSYAENLTVINSTISSNGASSGGGIANSGNLTITNSTFTDNSAYGGAIYNFAGAAQIEDSVLKAGEFGTIVNAGGSVLSLGHNIASDDGGGVLIGPGDQINTDPLVGPLQNNGGPTFTHALLPGSPAINAGEPNFTPPPFFDQRGPGFHRLVNSRIDIGSFEVQGPTPTPSATPTPRPSPIPRPRPTPTPRA
jgi:Right handed beta helix region